MKGNHTPEEAKLTITKTVVGGLSNELGIKTKKREVKTLGKLVEVNLNYGPDLVVKATGISKVSAEVAALEELFQLLLDRKFSKALNPDHHVLSDGAAADVLIEWNTKTRSKVEISVQTSDQGFLASCVSPDGRNFQATGPSKRIAKAHVAREFLADEISVATRNQAAEVKRLIRAEKFNDAYRLYLDHVLPSACPGGFKLALLEIFSACLAHDRGVLDLIFALAPKSIDFETLAKLLDAAVTASDADIFARLEKLTVSDAPSRLKKLRCLLALERHAQIHQARECLEDLEKFPLQVVSVDFPVIKAVRNFSDSGRTPGKSGTSATWLPRLGSSGQMAVLETKEENFLCEASESPDGITLKVPPSQSLERVRRVVSQEGTLVLLGDVETTYLRASEALRQFYMPQQGDDQICPWIRAAVVEGVNRQLHVADEERISKFAAKYSLSSGQTAALKSSQEFAVTLVQGAPGAGKTHVSGAMIDLWRASGAKVLVVADSNAAVDNLRAMLKSRGVQCLRIGKFADQAYSPSSPVAVNQDALDLLVGTPIYAEYLRRSAVLTGPGKSVSQSSHPPELWFLKRRVEQAAVEAAQVVLTTCVGSGHELLAETKFEKVLMDEATQSVEPVTLIPLMRGCDQVVLIGDHKQLPPTVVSQEARERGLGLSLFERLTDFPLHLLDIQRRMHPSIMEFSNQHFYNNRVLTNTPDRPIIPGFPWPKADSCRVCLVQTTSGSEDRAGRSRHNAREAELVLDIVRKVIRDGGVHVKDIGVIVPYNAQRQKILNRIRYNSDDDKTLVGLAVNTVDSFQGQEKDLIIFSAVRSNAQGQLGFLDDPRRINVTLTRAKRGLIVIADDQTLSRRGRSIWAQWVKWIHDKGSVIHESQLSSHLACTTKS
jgi:hypothetical protein